VDHTPDNGPGPVAITDVTLTRHYTTYPTWDYYSVLVATPGCPRDCARAIGNCSVAFLDHGSIIPYGESGCTSCILDL